MVLQHQIWQMLRIRRSQGTTSSLPMHRAESRKSNNFLCPWLGKLFQGVLKKLKINTLSPLDRSDFQSRDDTRALTSTSERISSDVHQESSLTEYHRSDCTGPDDLLYISRVDRCSEREIVVDCEALNNRMRNTVFNVTDQWTRFSVRETGGSAIQLRPEDHETLRSILGETLYNLIKSFGESRSTLDEIEDHVTDALQTFITYSAHQIISDTFCPVMNEYSNATNQRLFTCMIMHERQPVALHWRALGYVHAVKSAPNGPTYATREFLSAFQSKLEHYFQGIFLLVGESTTSPFLPRVSQMLSKCGVIEAAIELAGKLKTSIFSTYIDTYWVMPKLVFDENVMEKAAHIETSIASHQTLVTCTLELGIREIVAVRAETQDRIGRILLKPKVLVEVSGSFASSFIIRANPQ
ncbi:uncharacterized protein FOMMEDRAFT_159801 [Fomitiporia mediterranea MF3/22]|uniref:uncharacterized protein n=1 Tax=Fomitiporia mediterranea (strain MF3/22) TaxID=694068 RepID=UPI0004408BD2|nr:uncharacterized protein FOMMEDRAFT_159801 [Fomitiporia mediterranea MF3/22]EJD00153.1 hypothetical protein FOMMEDRAFT_159801 [Fomitiporia mediterranea MF3/22]